MSSNQSPNRKVVVVTGASAGIGRAVALAFAARGDRVALLARSVDALETVATEVELAGGEALALGVDVADAGAVEAAAARIEAHWGGIDIWVNNAMATIFAPVHRIAADEFRRVTEVTYLGAVHGTMAALARMRPRRRGVIVQVGSALAYRAIPLQSAYCGAKHAVRGFTDALRVELMHDGAGIHLTMVQLSAFNTPQFDWARSRMPRRAQPVPPIFQPELAARAVVWATQVRRREICVGGPAVKAIWGNKLVPGFADRLLRKQGYDGQMTDRDEEPQRADNLFAPVPGLHRTHGRFDTTARASSLQLSWTMWRARIAQRLGWSAPPDAEPRTGSAKASAGPEQSARRDSGNDTGPDDAMQRHMQKMSQMRRNKLWTQFAIIGLGAWLLSSPWQFGLFDPAAAPGARDITAERGLWAPALRNALLGWSDIVCGVLLMLFGALALRERRQWAQWGSAVVGLWLLFAPLLFWTTSAAAYSNELAVGALAIAFSILIPMMPGMSHEGMMDEGVVPPGWDYSPSSWLQRLPLVVLGLVGFLIARYQAGFQMGHFNQIWEPFFTGADGRNGTAYIITSDVSKAWPIADAGLGASSYLIETLMACMGTAKRWRTMPWMVTFFFILVVPLSGVSIGFIMIQPVMLGTYCTLCLVAAFAMLLMIPLTLDEVWAMAQYMKRSLRAGRPFLKTFLHGGPDVGDGPDPGPDFSAPPVRQVAAGLRGTTLPWTLLACCALGIWLMFTPLLLGTQGAIADSDHLSGATILTLAVCATAEVARWLRWGNVVAGAWLLLAPWVLGDAEAAWVWNDLVAGTAVILLSLPRGRISGDRYGRA